MRGVLFQRYNKQEDSHFFIIVVQNNLKMCKSDYGTDTAALLAGKQTAKHYKIDLTPPWKSTGKGVAQKRKDI